MQNLNFIIILVYSATNNPERSKKTTEAEKLIKEHEHIPTIILGDMNAHLGTLFCEVLTE